MPIKSVVTPDLSAPRSIVITGASSGIGEALALHYAAPGVALALTGRDRARLDAVGAACMGKGAVAVTAIIDVTDRAAMRAWLSTVDRDHPVDLVIANAGISGGSGSGDEDEDQARSIFDVNLIGVLNTIHPLIPAMTLRGRGQVAIMASLAGFSGWPGAPAYSASKGAVRFYGEALRGALACKGIHVSVICPGFVESRMTAVNPYKMPFLMPVDPAARLIARRLAAGAGLIAFPWQTQALALFLAALPGRVRDNILTKLPKKPALPR